jgi:type IV pilus assembly protein PilA
MGKFTALFILSTAAVASAGAQVSQTSAPQTARQALMEMFSTKGSGTFVKHLPAATLSALENAGALKSLQQYSTLAGQFHRTGNQLETFETGPILLASDDPKTGQRVEVIVDSDSVQGDADNIELSFRTYKDKQLQRTPFMPRITFCMKMESGVWKLNEILVSMRVPLADPDFLKSITEGMKSRTAAMAQTQSQSQPSTITFGGDSAVVTSMRSILTAEMTYKSTYASVGYTCTLSDLDGFGGGEPNEHQAMLIASGLASGKKQGYIFTLSGCEGRPATSFHLAAAPAGNSFGRRAFCADQSGENRYSTDGSPVTCRASGIPMP